MRRHQGLKSNTNFFYRDLVMNQELHNTLKNIETMMEILLKKSLQPDTTDELDIEAAAVMCDLSVKTLYTYKNRGKLNIPCIKRGNAVFWKREDLLRWKAERSYKIIHRHGVKTKVQL